MWVAAVKRAQKIADTLLYFLRCFYATTVFFMPRMQPYYYVFYSVLLLCHAL